MKRFITALSVCLLTGFAAVTAQQQEKPTPNNEVIVAGCLAQGSLPSIFILEDAKPTAGTLPPTGMRYLVVAETKDVDLMAHLNHQVQLRGTVQGPIPPPEKQREEMDLPKLQAVELTVLASTCGAAAGSPRRAS